MIRNGFSCSIFIESGIGVERGRQKGPAHASTSPLPRGINSRPRMSAPHQIGKREWPTEIASTLQVRWYGDSK